MGTPTYKVAPRPWRIGLLYDHTLQVGGVETYLLTLIRHADPRQFQFTLFSQTRAPFTRQATELGATIVDWQRWLPADLAAPWALARVLKQHAIDLVHCHAPIAAIWGRAAARLAGIPAVVSVHLPMDQYHGSGQWLRARLGRWLYTGIDRALNHSLGTSLVFVSENVRREQIGRGHVRATQTRVFPTGVDLQRYESLPDRTGLRAEFGSTPDAVVLVCVGRLELEKGQDVLLHATARLAEQHVAFQLWLVGDGPQREALEKQVKAAGLADRVTFFGYRADIPRLLGAADVFVLPSRYEVAPIALLEALAAGLPVVASRCGEIPSWIEQGCEGLLVEPEDAAALTAALAEVILQPARRAQLAQAARARRSRFSDQSMTAAYYELYRRLLEPD